MDNAQSYPSSGMCLFEIGLDYSPHIAGWY